jgi:hypothetical protein
MVMPADHSLQWANGRQSSGVVGIPRRGATSMTGEIKPIHLDWAAALMAASRTRMSKEKDEVDTAFVKRIVCAYLNAHQEIASTHARLKSKCWPKT